MNREEVHEARSEARRHRHRARRRLETSVGRQFAVQGGCVTSRRTRPVPSQQSSEWLLGTLVLASAAFVASPWARPFSGTAASVACVWLLTRMKMYWTVGFPEALIIRRTVRVLVFFLPAFVLARPSLRFDIPGVVACAVIAAVPHLGRLRELRLSLDPLLLSLLAPMSAREKAADMITFGFSGAGQEYLYRYAVIIVCAPLTGNGAAVAVAAALFVGEHWVWPEAKPWQSHDVAAHTFLAVGFGAVVVISGSLMPVILGHTLYNTPQLIQVVRRPRARSEKGAE